MSHYRHCQEKSGVASLRSESRPRATVPPLSPRIAPAWPNAPGHARRGPVPRRAKRRGKEADRDTDTRLSQPASASRARATKTMPVTSAAGHRPARTRVPAIASLQSGARWKHVVGGPAGARQGPPGNPERTGGSRGSPSRRYRRRSHDRVSRRRTTQRPTAIGRDALPGREAPRTGAPPRPAGEAGRPQPWNERASCVAGAA